MTSLDGSASEGGSLPDDDAGFDVFSREHWAAIARSRTESTLSISDTQRLVATGEPVSLDEVVDIYLPLARLLEVIAATKHDERRRIDAFLTRDRAMSPFIVGIAGGVAVGKSTTARVLQALLREGEGGPTVDLLTTDGFLYPNSTLEARGILNRKGFPESYDQRELIQVLAAIRSGAPEVRTPVYSHVAYDIVPGEQQVLRRPNIVIVEGLNVLQVNTKGASPDHVVVSDFFDFSIYVDAAESDVAEWFRNRLLSLRSTVLQAPESYFHRFASMTDQEVTAIAQQVWNEVNLINLQENVAPTRGRAHLIMEKDSQHLVNRVLLRRA
ncbi:MAG: type I pantothenate kinase [Acidimicrobiales bacterium]